MTIILKRREFVVGVVGFGMLALPGCRNISPLSGVKSFQPSGGQSLRVRKAISTLNRNSSDIVALAKAITAMRELEGPPSKYIAHQIGSAGIPQTNVLKNPFLVPPAPGLWSQIPADARSWFRQAQIHWDRCVHEEDFFLPWHRYFIWYFEQLVQKYSGDPEFALPYWDYENNPELPDFFKPEFSSPGVRNPFFIEGRQLEPSLLKLANLEMVLRSASGRNYADVSSNLLGNIHSNQHTYIGGEMGGNMSPLDPIFWLHHGGIDRLWQIWMNRDPRMVGPNDFDSWLDSPEFQSWNTEEFHGFVDADGNAAQSFAHLTLTTELFGYTYDDLDLPLLTLPKVRDHDLLTQNEIRDEGLTLTQESELHFVDVQEVAEPTISSTVRKFSIPQRSVRRLHRVLKQHGFLDGGSRKQLNASPLGLVLSEIPTPVKLNTQINVVLAAGAVEVHVATFTFFSPKPNAMNRFTCEFTYPYLQLLSQLETAALSTLEIVLKMQMPNGDAIEIPNGAKVDINYVAL